MRGFFIWRTQYLFFGLIINIFLQPWRPLPLFWLNEVCPDIGTFWQDIRFLFLWKKKNRTFFSLFPFLTRITRVGNITSFSVGIFWSYWCFIFLQFRPNGWKMPSATFKALYKNFAEYTIWLSFKQTKHSFLLLTEILPSFIQRLFWDLFWVLTIMRISAK